MNRLLTHFLLSNVKKQLSAKLKKKFPEDDNGELLSITYLGEGEKITQRVTFEKKQIDSPLDENDKKMFQSIPGLDINKELKTCKSIIAQLNFKDKKIIVVYYYEDGKTKTLNY